MEIRTMDDQEIAARLLERTKAKRESPERLAKNDAAQILMLIQEDELTPQDRASGLASIMYDDPRKMEEWESLYCLYLASEIATMLWGMYNGNLLKGRFIENQGLRDDYNHDLDAGKLIPRPHPMQ